jgi:hypothetical protein
MSVTMTEPETRTLGGKTVHVEDVKLVQDIYLVTLRRHRWQGEHVIKRTQVAVAVSEHQVDDDMIKKVAATLIPKPLQRQLSGGYSEIDRVLRRYTYDFSGSVAVAAGSINGFFAEFQEAREKLAAIVADFADRYEVEVVEYNQAKWGPRLGDAYDEVIGQLLPDRNELPSRFGVDIVDLKKLEAPSFENMMAKLDSKILAEVKKNKAVEYASAMDQLVEGPRKVLDEAIAGLIQQLSTGEIVRRDSFNAVLDAIALNRNFAGTVTNQALLDTARALEDKITEAIGDAEAKKTSSNTYSDLLSGHKDTLLAAMKPVVAAAQDQVAMAQVRQQLHTRVRRVDID